MNRFKPIAAMLMLALFAFASSHPLLEGLGLIHQDVAHADGPASSDSDHELADGKCRVNCSRGDIPTPQANGAFDFAAVLALASGLIHQVDLKTGSAVEIASSPPPELGPSWQFSSRAALPVRAPSLAS